MQTYLGIKRESLGQTWTHIPVLLLSRGMVYKMEVVYLQGCCGKQMKVWMCISILCQYDSSWYLTTLGSSPEIKKRTYQTWKWPYKNMTLLSWEENGKISVEYDLRNIYLDLFSRGPCLSFVHGPDTYSQVTVSVLLLSPEYQRGHFSSFAFISLVALWIRVS